jgi:hypothetical protein
MKEYKACESPDYITYVSDQVISSFSLLNPSQGAQDGDQPA